MLRFLDSKELHGVPIKYQSISNFIFRTVLLLAHLPQCSVQFEDLYLYWELSTKLQTSSMLMMFSSLFVLLSDRQSARIELLSNQGYYDYGSLQIQFYLS